MAYLAHSKRARVESYDNGDHNQAVIDHKEQLLLRVRELYLNRDFADIEFTIGSDVVPAHKAIVCVTSKWRQLVGQEREVARVELEDTPLTPFKELLRYVYTGKLGLENYELEMLTEIRQLAENYEMWTLAELIQEREELQITIDNVVGLYGQSTVNSMTGKSCLSFIAHNSQDVLDLDEFYDLDAEHVMAVFRRNDLNINEKAVFEAAVRYVTNTGESEKNKKFVLSLVRLELLSFDYLWSAVRKFCEEHKMISIDELGQLSVAKSKISALNPEIRDRALCLPNTADVVALNSKKGLATRVIKGKLADFGEEANSLEVDLGVHYLLTGLGLMLSNQSKHRYSFKLETSVDSNTWEALYDFSKYHTSNKLDLAFDPKVIRYLRITNALSYPDWAGKRTESKPLRKFYNIVAVYEEPSGLVKLRDNLLASKYLFQHMSCDFMYKSWFKKDGKNFYVCAINDPIVCILSQPVWMESISLYLPEEEDKEYNFTVEVTSEAVALVSTAQAGRGKNKEREKGWQMVANFEDTPRRGHVDILFEPTVVNVFRVTGTRIVNSKGKEKDFAVEIRI